MIIKTTVYDYSCLVAHHPELGFIFIARAQENDNGTGSRWHYPVIQIASGEAYDLEPHELLGSWVMEDMFLRFKKERLPL